MYKKRISVNPDVFETILAGNILFGDYIETTRGGRITKEAWQRNKPPILNEKMIYTQEDFLRALPDAVQIEMQMIMDGAISVGVNVTEIATNRATLRVIDRSFSVNKTINSNDPETQGMYNALQAIVGSFTPAVRALLETGE